RAGPPGGRGPRRRHRRQAPPRADRPPEGRRRHGAGRTARRSAPGPVRPVGVQYRAATRGSPLALWQTRHVASLISRADPSVELVEVVVQTQGDRRLDVPIHEIGGKGVFAKEVQLAVLEGRADLAVHSGKDLPAVTPPGLVVAA